MAGSKKVELFPEPRTIAWSSELFDAGYDLGVYLPEEFACLEPLLKGFLARPCVDAPAYDVRACADSAEANVRVVVDAAQPAQGYELVVAADGARIAASTPQGAFYGLVTLGQLASAGPAWPCCRIVDEPALARRGFMLDISRGKVPTMAELCAP